MKRKDFLLLLVFLGVAGQFLFAQSPGIPPEHAEKAKQAFEAGYPYYIWYDGKEPLHGDSLPGVGPFSIRGMIQFDIQYAANGETLPPFLKHEAVVVQEGKGKNKSLKRYLNDSVDPIQPKTRSDKTSVTYLSMVQLSGEGDIEISLIEPEAKSKAAESAGADKKPEPRQLSNTLRVHVVFGTEGKK
jgi:hypothetical protein